MIVGDLIGKHEVEIGFQQVSEMGTNPRVDMVGPLPAEVQRVNRQRENTTIGA